MLSISPHRLRLRAQPLAASVTASVVVALRLSSRVLPTSPANYVVRHLELRTVQHFDCDRSARLKRLPQLTFDSGSPLFHYRLRAEVYAVHSEDTIALKLSESSSPQRQVRARQRPPAQLKPTARPFSSTTVPCQLPHLPGLLSSPRRH